MTQAAEGEAQAYSTLASAPERAQLDFYELPRPIQDRFLASAAGTGAPKVILFEPASAVSGIGWIAVFVVSASVVSGLAVTGYGNLQNPMALQSIVMTPAYGAFGGLAAVALAAYAWTRSAHSRYLYPLGTYLFPAGLLVTHDEKLRWRWITDLESVEAAGSNKVRLKFSDGIFTFSLTGDVTLEHLQRVIEDAKRRFIDATEQRDRRLLASMDPLRDSGFSNPLSGQKALKRPRDQRLWRYSLAAIVGGAVAVAVFFARNKLGEQVLYKVAREADSIEAYKSYLARGGEREDVRTLLLPRAVLTQIKASLPAVEKYSADNPESKIRPEIDEALRQGLRQELQKARDAGSLKDLLEFREAHPDHGLIENEIALARAAVYQAALDDYTKSAKADADAQQVFIKLIQNSQKNGPKVLVRFRRNPPRNADGTDRAIRRSAYYAGQSSLPSQYFDDEHVLPREADAGKELVAKLQEPFSPEILKFELAEGITGEDELPKVEHPTLFITHVITMSGGYTTNRPRNVYVGLGVKIEGHFVVPGMEEPWSMKYTVWLPPDVSEISRDRLKPEDVYDKNSRLGFERFNEKLLGELLPQVQKEDE